MLTLIISIILAAPTTECCYLFGDVSISMLTTEPECPKPLAVQPDPRTADLCCWYVGEELICISQDNVTDGDHCPGGWFTNSPFCHEEDTGD